MFGYVLPLTAELKVREWHAYRAYYCGLCKELKREYGFLSRFLLNYDLVLPALLADGMAGTQARMCPERCMANPVEKRSMCQSTAGLALDTFLQRALAATLDDSLAADALVLTVYYKLADDLADERFFKRLPALVLWPFLSRMRKKAAVRRPALDETLREQTAAQQALERRASKSADEAADPTARMTAALFRLAAPGSRALERMGLFVGKIIYYLDAAEDYEKDIRNGAYNVFALQGLSKAEAVAEAQRLCRMCAGEAALAYNLLEPGPCKAILDNIVFLGLPQSIALAGQKRTQPRHGA